jgi:phosphinothricin acetyltransferase
MAAPPPQSPKRPEKGFRNVTGQAVVVRDAVARDIPDVAHIYAHHVINGLASFEERPPSGAEMLARYEAIAAMGYPYLVAEIDSRIVGYAYASAYRPRPAYRFTVENSVYVDNASRGNGIGSALLKTLIGRCEGGIWRQMLAVIGDSANAGSIALHSRHGFRPAGSLLSVGFKHGRWVDSVIMQRPLATGDSTLPPAVIPNEDMR